MGSVCGRGRRPGSAGSVGRMARLLIVHHTPSPALHTLFEAAHAGATDPQIDGVEVVARPALVATAVDVLEADGYLLGTPANLGYMSGALKHFFDTIYYPCLDATVGRPLRRLRPRQRRHGRRPPGHRQDHHRAALVEPRRRRCRWSAPRRRTTSTPAGSWARAVAAGLMPDG